MPKLVSGIEVMGKSLWRFQRVSHRPSRRCTPVTDTHLLATATHRNHHRYYGYYPRYHYHGYSKELGAASTPHRTPPRLMTA